MQTSDSEVSGGALKLWVVYIALYVAFWFLGMVFTASLFGLVANVVWDGSVAGLVRFIGSGGLVAAPHYDTEYGLYLFLATFCIPGILTWLTVKRLNRHSKG